MQLILLPLLPIFVLFIENAIYLHIQTTTYIAFEYFNEQVRKKMIIESLLKIAHCLNYYFSYKNYLKL